MRHCSSRAMSPFSSMFFSFYSIDKLPAILRSSEIVDNKLFFERVKQFRLTMVNRSYYQGPDKAYELLHGFELSTFELTIFYCIYTCTCICNLQFLCNSPYEYFYGVIVTQKQTIRIITNSLPIIEKDYNYTAISTVSDEYFFLSLSRRESAFGHRKRVG